MNSIHQQFEILVVLAIGPTRLELAWFGTADGWAPVTAIAETIQVRGADPVVYTRRRTINGPLVDVDPRPDSVHAVALRWVAQDGGADELAALHGWARAADAGEFVRAAATFRSPEQNVVYADSGGHIGYLLAGAVPVRRAGEGVFPVAGAAGPPWTRYLAPDELPAEVDPREGASRRPTTASWATTSRSSFRIITITPTAPGGSSS
jgi:penicillin amidase